MVPAVCMALPVCPEHRQGMGTALIPSCPFIFLSLGVATHDDMENACEEVRFPWLLREGQETAMPALGCVSPCFMQVGASLGDPAEMR